MITAIEIENFKGIGERIKIPLKPITLLFGANSAGKSTILQAIHYVREILDRQNLDAGKTIAGGECIDLGGFAEFVHKKDLNRSITIRLDFKLDWRSGKGLKDYLTDDKYLNDFEISFDADSDKDDEYVSYDVNLGGVGHGLPIVTDYWLEFDVSYSSRLQKPYVARYSIGAEGETVADILYTPGNKEAEITNILEEHPLFHSYLEFDENTHQETELLRDLYWNCEIHDTVKSIEELSIPFETTPEYGAMPVLGKKFDLPTLLPEDLDLPKLPANADHEIRWSHKKQQNQIIAGKAIAALLTQYLVASAEYARDYLADLRYVGPLRAVPPANYYKPRVIDYSRWANGMTAWDKLSTPGNEGFVQEVSFWLSDQGRLNTGYELLTSQVRDIDDYFQKRMLKAEWDEEDPEIRDSILKELQRIPVKRKIQLFDINKDTYVSPNAVGVGLSQVIPVITAILADGAKVVQVEQPGLHLHPTQQAAIGDLLIAGAKQQRKQLLIETHSEHLILRLLRRIRETSRAKLDDDLLAISPKDIEILYIQSKEGQTGIKIIDIDTDGEFVQPWPDDFFDQDFHERFA